MAQSSQGDTEAGHLRGWLHEAGRVVGHRVPILQWIGSYNRVDAVSDLIAGVTLGLTLIPQSIAYSALAGVPPQYGLNSAFIGCFVYIIFGTIKEVSIGPTSLMSLLTLEYTRHLTPNFVVALCFYVGCVEFLMGVFRLGFLVDFISIPVTSGFQTASSFIIIISQMKGILGVRFKSCSYLDNIYQLFVHIKETNWTGDFALGISCIIFLFVMRSLKDVPLTEDSVQKRVLKRALWFLATSRNFIAVVVSAGISYYFETRGEIPFKLSGNVLPGLPPFRIPDLTLTMGNQTYSHLEVLEEFGAGVFVIPTVAVLANVAIAKAFITGGTIDATQEMLTLSLCNILGSFVQSMPTCGAFTRSAVASASGIRTPLAGLYAGMLTMLALTFLTPYFHLIPRSTLSAVLISAVVFLIDYQILLPLWHTDKRELCVVLVTLVSCICIGVEIGLFLGVIFSTCHLIYLWARPHTFVITRKVNMEQSILEYVVVTPSIGMFFPAADIVCNHLIKAGVEQGEGVKPVVLNCTHFTSLDHTSAKGLNHVIRDFNKRGQALVFLNMSPKISRSFHFIGCKDIQICPSEEQLETFLSRITLGNHDSKTLQEDSGPEKEVAHEVIPLMDQKEQNYTS